MGVYAPFSVLLNIAACTHSQEGIDDLQALIHIRTQEQR
jgi:hypothetical protein